MPSSDPITEHLTDLSLPNTPENRLALLLLAASLDDSDNSDEEPTVVER